MNDPPAKRYKLPLPIAVVAWLIAAMAGVKLYQMVFTEPAERERELRAQEKTASNTKPAPHITRR